MEKRIKKKATSKQTQDLINAIGEISDRSKDGEKLGLFGLFCIMMNHCQDNIASVTLSKRVKIKLKDGNKSVN